MSIHLFNGPIAGAPPEPLLLEAVTIRLIQNSERERFDEELVTKHYLKNANAVGRVLRYVAEYRDQWVALLVFCSSAFHIKLRDQWLHWLPRQVKERRHLIAQNARFLVLAAPGQWPNLASRVLKLAGERLAADWQEHFGYPVLVLETFVDPQRFRGTLLPSRRVATVGTDPRLRTGLAGLLHRYPASQATVGTALGKGGPGASPGAGVARGFGRPARSLAASLSCAHGPAGLAVGALS